MLTQSADPQLFTALISVAVLRHWNGPIYPIAPPLPLEREGPQSVFFPALGMALFQLGWASQTILNVRLGTFAGDFRIVAFRDLFLVLLEWAHFSGRLVGQHAKMLNGGVSEGTIEQNVKTIVTAYLAFTLPRVEQNVVDEDDE